MNATPIDIAKVIQLSAQQATKQLAKQSEWDNEQLNQVCVEYFKILVTLYSMRVNNVSPHVAGNFEQILVKGLALYVEKNFSSRYHSISPQEWSHDLGSYYLDDKTGDDLKKLNSLGKVLQVGEYQSQNVIEKLITKGTFRTGLILGIYYKHIIDLLPITSNVNMLVLGANETLTKNNLTFSLD